MAARILIDTLALLTGPMAPEACPEEGLEFRFHAEFIERRWWRCLLMMTSWVVAAFQRISMFIRNAFSVFVKTSILTRIQWGRERETATKNFLGRTNFQRSRPTKWRSLRVGVASRRRGDVGGNLWAMSGMAWRGTCRPAGLISYAVRPANVIIQYILRALHAELRSLPLHSPQICMAFHLNFIRMCVCVCAQCVVWPHCAPVCRPFSFGFMRCFVASSLLLFVPSLLRCCHFRRTLQFIKHFIAPQGVLPAQCGQTSKLFGCQREPQPQLKTVRMWRRGISKRKERSCKAAGHAGGHGQGCQLWVASILSPGVKSKEFLRCFAL